MSGAKLKGWLMVQIECEIVAGMKDFVVKATFYDLASGFGELR